jgi:hypothetical protein
MYDDYDVKVFFNREEGDKAGFFVENSSAKL